MRTAERGFTLLEVVVCVGLFAIAAAATAGALAATLRNATPGIARDVALMVAENALVRARAAAAYAASPPGVDVMPLVADRSWALRPGTSQWNAGAQIVAPAACGGAPMHLLRLAVATTFDPATQQVTVRVTYPRNGCDAASDAGDLRTLTLTQTLPPPVYAPGQTIVRDVLTPARM